MKIPITIGSKNVFESASAEINVVATEFAVCDTLPIIKAAVQVAIIGTIKVKMFSVFLKNLLQKFVQYPARYPKRIHPNIPGIPVILPEAFVKVEPLTAIRAPHIAAIVASSPLFAKAIPTDISINAVFTARFPTPNSTADTRVDSPKVLVPDVYIKSIMHDRVMSITPHTIAGADNL